ncbi:hypothetical protein E4U53_004003 [Claviceps sorghi]|nr:hypothetical protein E4U53_004003 [Claviceps sorghi]
MQDAQILRYRSHEDGKVFDIESGSDVELDGPTAWHHQRSTNGKVRSSPLLPSPLHGMTSRSTNSQVRCAPLLPEK